ncbi:MAG: hypothetical protein QM535_11030 [Limnohabitans sp.]|nr:hypothetical protein [Limnohabitans sp.]
MISKHKTIDYSVLLNNKSTFTLAEDKDDQIGTLRDLRQMLIDAGLNYTSLNNAENAIKNRIVNQENNLDKELERAFNIKDINSVFQIILNYQMVRGFDKSNHILYKEFYYIIKDLNTGKVIHYGKITNSTKNSKSVLKSLVMKIKSKISN